MSWEDALLFAGYGFSFEVPVPLPLLGHRAAYTLRNELFVVNILLELKPIKPRAGGLSMSGGICYHERDRFGLFAGSKLEVRIDQTPDRLLELDLFKPLASFEVDGKLAYAIGPGVKGMDLCASLVNLLVDLQTTAFSSHWVPHVTPDDILQLSLIDWSDPGKPQGMGYMAGTDNHKFKFGLQPGFPSPDPERIKHILKSWPLDLWEELIHAALRDLELGRHRSTLMHACLALETYVRRVLELNPSPARDTRYMDRTLKELVVKRSCLPSVIGHNLDSTDGDPAIREHYQRIAALRDSIMHKGNLSYPWPSRTSKLLIIETPTHVRAHIFSVLNVIWHISSRLEAEGKVSGNRAIVPRPTDLQ